MGKSKVSYIRAYEQLKKGIIEGDYTEDYVFVETELAEQLGMSRTPVREAIRMLKAENLLVGVQGHGLTAQHLKKDDVRNVYEVAEALEGMMAYIVARRKNKEDNRSLGESVFKMEEALRQENKEAWALADREYHAKLIEFSRNEFLKNAIKNLNVYIDMIRIRFTRESGEERRSSTVKHREEYEAIASGDADYARMVVQYHWHAIRRQTVEAMK